MAVSWLGIFIHAMPHLKPFFDCHFINAIILKSVPSILHYNLIIQAFSLFALLGDMGTSVSYSPAVVSSSQWIYFAVFDLGTPLVFVPPSGAPVPMISSIPCSSRCTNLASYNLLKIGFSRIKFANPFFTFEMIFPFMMLSVKGSSSRDLSLLALGQG